MKIILVDGLTLIESMFLISFFVALGCESLAQFQTSNEGKCPDCIKYQSIIYQILTMNLLILMDYTIFSWMIFSAIM